MGGINDKIQGQDILGIRLTGPNGEVKNNKLVSDMGEVTLTNEFLISREFSSANEFSQWIEEQNFITKIPRMDLIINYCQSKEIDIETVAPLINKVLKEKIRKEAEEARLMKPTGRLPL